MKPSAFGLAVVLVSSSIPACQCKRNTSPGEGKRPSRLRIRSVDVVMAPGPAALPNVSKKTVREWTVGELRQARHLLLLSKRGRGASSEDATAHRLRIRVGRTVDERGDTVGMVSVTARRPARVDSLAFQSAVAFDAATEQANPGQLKLAVRQALVDIDFQAELAFGSPKRLLTALASAKDAQRLITAIDIAALRRARDAVPRLVVLLKHEDERVADRAIGALVAIGDRAAVKPLTRLAKYEDTEKLAKLIDGIAALGGSEADSYLEFVAAGHPDADIRDMAAEALRRGPPAAAADAG